MNKFDFYNPVKLIFGEGQISRVGREAAKLGAKALLVSYKEHEFFADLLAKIESKLASSGVGAAAFYEVTANPTIEQVRRGVAACKDAEADMVIGVGGGSAMDAAKLIGAGVLYDGDPWNMVVSRHDDVTAVPPEKALPLMMVPTLPATGSEMNCCGVVTNEETCEKSYAWASCLYPAVSIADPALTCSLPPYQTACGAADTISHVMEFYINGLEGTPLNNRIQEGVILTVMENVPLALEDPDDIDARANLQWASIVALNGWSQPGDAWTPVHQVGHVLSARYGVTHGASLSIVMPAWMRHLHPKRPDRYVQFAERVFDIDVAGRDDADLAEEAIDRFEAFIRSIGVETRLSDAAIPAEEIGAIVDDVVRISFGSDGMLSSRPPVSREDLTAILKLAE